MFLQAGKAAPQSIEPISLHLRNPSGAGGPALGGGAVYFSGQAALCSHGGCEMPLLQGHGFVSLHENGRLVQSSIAVGSARQGNEAIGGESNGKSRGAGSPCAGC